MTHKIEYQSFWTLGANRHFLNDDRVVRFAKRKGLTPETLMYAFVMELGITPLDVSVSYCFPIRETIFFGPFSLLMTLFEYNLFTFI